MCKCVLLHSSQLSSPNQTLEDCLIANGAVLLLADARFAAQPFTFFVKTLAGETMTFQMEECITVGDLKSMIKDIQGTPPDQMRLIIDGTQLSEVDDDLLFACGIRHGTILHLVLRLRGT